MDTESYQQGRPKKDWAETQNFANHLATKMSKGIPDTITLVTHYDKKSSKQRRFDRQKKTWLQNT